MEQTKQHTAHENQRANDDEISVAPLEFGQVLEVHAVDASDHRWHRTDAGITALRVNCTHQGFPVGRVGAVLECELHGSRFNPETGAVINGPAARPLTRYEATETNGGIYVTVTSN